MMRYPLLFANRQNENIDTGANILKYQYLLNNKIFIFPKFIIYYNNKYLQICNYYDLFETFHIYEYYKIINILYFKIFIKFILINLQNLKFQNIPRAMLY